MPIFEFVCQECDEPFEELVRGDERITCPRCRSARLTKRFSTFASSPSSSTARAQASSPGSCGTCGDPRGPGACRRD